MVTKEKRIDCKQLPLEYQILEFKIALNQELYEEHIISYQIFTRMQNLLFKRMNKIIGGCYGHHTSTE